MHNKSINLEKRIDLCYRIYKEYSSLINCYGVDFFTENHWNKLENNFQIFLKHVDPIDLATLLNYKQDIICSSNKIGPLSLLALKRLVSYISLSREIVNVKIECPAFTKDNKLLKLFWKNVKAKKRHEISTMSKICYQSARKTNCFYIVDIGSGVGHLSRMLSYGYKFNVCTIEAQETLSEQASKLDQEFQNLLEKKHKEFQNDNQKPIHIKMKIESDIRGSEFLKIIKDNFDFKTKDFSFGIVGLHPCGDLGATLLRLYNECKNIKYINLVGCCYMKLTSFIPGKVFQGFPLSDFCKHNNYALSYQAKEMACHAIESYTEKLLQGECWRLKIHAYRALLEKIIVSIRPDLQHSAVTSVKYSQDLTFPSYCVKALNKLNITIPEEQLENDIIEYYISQWRQVVAFYSLRLLFAPLIESILLLDRYLYVQEAGNDCEIISAFDPKISPRSHVLMANRD